MMPWLGSASRRPRCAANVRVEKARVVEARRVLRTGGALIGYDPSDTALAAPFIGSRRVSHRRIASAEL